MKNRSGDRTTHSHITNLFQICSLRIQLAKSLLALAARDGFFSPAKLACVASVSSRVIARKLERPSKKNSSPPPLSFLFFCSRPNFLDELARKRLLRRLLRNVLADRLDGCIFTGYPIWSTLVGCEELAAWFEPIRNGDIFWMNNNVYFWNKFYEHFQADFSLSSL